MVVVLCFTLTAVATALIYWRWANVTEPSSYVIVQGSEPLNGTVVTISAENRQDVVAMGTLSADNNYSVTIFLHPGTYWFSAVQRETTLLEGPMFVAHRRWKTIPLTPPPQRTPGEAGSGAGNGRGEAAGGDAAGRAGVS